MKKLSEVLARILRVLVIALTVALVLDVTLQILGRYILRTPYPWTEELSRLLLVSIVTLAAPLAAKDDRYVRVDVLTNRLPEKVRGIFVPLTDLLVAVFLFFVAYQAIGLTRTGALQKTPVLRVPMSWAYGCMIVCPALSGFYFALNAVSALKRAIKPCGGDKG